MTHTHTFNYSALCQQPGCISYDGESRSFTHSHTDTHTHLDINTHRLHDEKWAGQQYSATETEWEHTHTLRHWALFCHPNYSWKVTETKTAVCKFEYWYVMDDTPTPTHTHRRPRFSLFLTYTNILHTRTPSDMNVPVTALCINVSLPAGLELPLEKRSSLYKSSVIWKKQKLIKYKHTPSRIRILLTPQYVWERIRG